MILDDMGIVVTLALCVYMASILHLIETDSKLFLRASYVVSAVAIFFAMATSRFRREIAPMYQRDRGALLLGLFVLYLLFQALTYPDPAVSENYIKIWILQVVTGTALGFLALSFFTCTQESLPSSSPARLNLYCAAIAIGVATLAWISWRLSLRLSEDYFSIESNTPSMYYYQIFGDYLFILYLCLTMLMRRAMRFASVPRG